MTASEVQAALALLATIHGCPGVEVSSGLFDGARRVQLRCPPNGPVQGEGSGIEEALRDALKPHEVDARERLAVFRSLGVVS